MQAAVQLSRSPKVDAFLGSGPLGQPTRAKRTMQTLDPGTGEALAEFYLAGPEDIDDAVKEARNAFEHSAWAEMRPNERGMYLHRLADLVERDRSILAEIESLDVGKPRPQSYWDIGEFAATMRYFADLAMHVRQSDPIPLAGIEARTVRQPWGACAFIVPWNFPFLLAGWGLSPALAAGNTVVIKPAEDTPLSTLYLMRLVREAGFPEGVVNVVPGLGEEAGAALARHSGIARMSFTGSPEVGRQIAEACGRNLVPVKLELGGKGAAVVFDDVDIEVTVERLTQAITFNCGQVCCTATRWFVQDDVYNRFVEYAQDRMHKVHVGYWNDPLTEMGPLVSQKQMDRVLGYINAGREDGAELVLEGGETEVVGHPGGFYVRPTVLAGNANNIAAREEIFGPVPYLIRFHDEEEAIELVNSSPYGLANSVWTEDLPRANRVAEAMIAGNSWINAHNVFARGLPYAGVKMSGMGGGVLSMKTLEDYYREQSIARPL